MKRLSLFACLALLGLGTTAALQTGRHTSPSDAQATVVEQATNGAYRDGLYLRNNGGGARRPLSRIGRTLGQRS